MTTHLTTLTSPEPVRSVLLLKSLILYLPNIINYISLPWCTDNKGKWRKTTHNLALSAWFWEKKQATSPVVQCVWHEICKYETTSLACEGIFTVLRGSQQTRHFLLQGLWFKSSQNDSDTKAAAQMKWGRASVVSEWALNVTFKALSWFHSHADTHIHLQQYVTHY